MARMESGPTQLLVLGEPPHCVTRDCYRFCLCSVLINSPRSHAGGHLSGYLCGPGLRVSPFVHFLFPLSEVQSTLLPSHPIQFVDVVLAAVRNMLRSPKLEGISAIESKRSHTRVGLPLSFSVSLARVPLFRPVTRHVKGSRRPLEACSRLTLEFPSWLLPYLQFSFPNSRRHLLSGR